MNISDQLAEVYERFGPPEFTNFDLHEFRENEAYRIGVFVVADHNGQVVLIRRTPIKAYPGLENYWWIPGGGQEGNESLAETAEREFREETGLTIVLRRTLLAQLPSEGSFILVFFRGQVLNGNLSAQVDPDRITAEARGFPLQGVPFDRLWTDQDKILLVREGFSVGDVEELIAKHGLKQRHNQASHATSEPAPGANSSAHEG